MLYNKELDEYYIDLLMPRHSQFKFLVDGKFELSQYYPKVTVSAKIQRLKLLIRTELSRITRSSRYLTPSLSYRT
jgi:hypothetical protein